jgi:pimeloyl-ACP methyl ester carboxylesterase
LVHPVGQHAREVRLIGAGLLREVEPLGLAVYVGRAMRVPKPQFVPFCLIALLGLNHSAPAQTTNTVTLGPLDRITNGVALTWQTALTGKVFTVQFQDTLRDGLWRIPASTAPYPTPTNWWIDPESTNRARFYRVVAMPATQRGTIITNSLVSTASAAYLTFLFNFGGVPITPQYDVRLYKIVYQTIGPLGEPTQASGALLLPDNGGQPLPLVSYQHGTITQTNLAPSSMDLLHTEVIIGAAFATSGYAAVTPDYLGLGASPGLHPYCHARSEATACIDMMRAARAFCASNGIVLTNRLFLCGYSQGGHATMALLRELETYYTNEFSVTACAPMAGPYDLSGVTTTNFLSAVAQPNPYYFLYLLGAYEDVYHFAPSLASILTPPYDTTLPPLLNGNTPGSTINAAMPTNAIPVEILKPEFLAAFKSDPRHPLRLALQDNDVYYWKPQAPLHLYHCAADRDVVIANSQEALATFQSLGATNVQLFDPVPSADHGGCTIPSLKDAKDWFDSLR